MSKQTLEQSLQALEDAPHIAFGLEGIVGLWCNVQTEGQQILSFDVINGRWNGIYMKKEGKILVSKTGKTMRAAILWRGKCPFSEADYNEAIAWIQEQIKCSN